MPDSDFWRELASDFSQAKTADEVEATRSYYSTQTIGEWQLTATAELCIVYFKALASRGASRIAKAGVDDLFVVWLEALWERAATGPVRTPSEIVRRYPNGLLYLRGIIKSAFQASAALCRVFESQAIQIEFEEKHLRTSREREPLTSASVKESTIANITPELPSIPVETIATHLEGLRIECRWSPEELAEAVRLNVRTVTRNLAGETKPHLRNLAKYERVFSKRLNRKVVIGKMP